jgi:hypothetical protein
MGRKGDYAARVITNILFPESRGGVGPETKMLPGPFRDHLKARRSHAARADPTRPDMVGRRIAKRPAHSREHIPRVRNHILKGKNFQRVRARS